MKKTILFIFIYLLFCCCSIQNKILYKFDIPVSQNIRKGIGEYSKLLNKPVKELKLFAIVLERDHEFEIFLQEYSKLPKSGLLELIQTTNRIIEIDSSLRIPIIFSSDFISVQIKRDNIVAIPLGGYYLKIVNNNNIQEVVQASFLF